MKQKHNVDKFLKAVQLWKKHPLHKNFLSNSLLIIYKTLLFYNPFTIYIYMAQDAWGVDMIFNNCFTSSVINQLLILFS